MHQDRRPLYKRLEEERSSKLIAYTTGDRVGLETQISKEVIDLFVHHLDLIGVTKKLSLFLTTKGGDVLASWSIVNLLRQFCDELEVIVPAKALSSGTLICLGADNVVMTKQATLGPIDPSVNGPLNPQVMGAGPQARVPVSVEAVNSYIEFARGALGSQTEGMADVLNQLSTQVHPLVLGDAYRSRAQIRMLGRRLIARHVQDEQQVEKVLNFLCSESGSHDYTIFRREARDQLALKIEKPTEDGYKLVKATYDDIARELELGTPYDPNVTLGQSNPAPYCFRRALIESFEGGCHAFVSEGTLHRQQIQVAPGVVQMAFRDDRAYEGWRHEP